MQSTELRHLGIPLLAHLRTLCGAPVMDLCTADAAVVSTVQARKSVTRRNVKRACNGLLDLILAAGYRASLEVRENGNNGPFSCQLNWSIPVGPRFEAKSANVLAHIALARRGWNTQITAHLGGEAQSMFNLDVVTLDEATLKRWLSLWLEAGLSHHGHLTQFAVEPVRH